LSWRYEQQYVATSKQYMQTADLAFTQGFAG
jgi:hypothetical protein